MATHAQAPEFALARRRIARPGDLALRGVAGLAVLIAALTIVLLVYEIFNNAWSSISAFGLSFVTNTNWNVVTGAYGARYLILGTLVTSLFALVIAVPTAIAIGLFLSELAPKALRTPVGLMVELLAAIPSVVLGLWGILVLGPFLANDVEPWLHRNLGFIPLFGGYPSAVGVLPACLVLTIMVVPIVASISRELFASVPGDLKSGALALGATRWEMVRGVAIPQVSAGLVAGVMLGFARAVGEAIAVAQVIGSHNGSPIGSLFKPSGSLAAWIATQFNGTATTMQRSSLYYLAVILLVISLFSNLGAQLIVRRIRRRMGTI